jgi:sulfate permease, SulP family
MVLACVLFVRRMGVLFEVTPVAANAVAKTPQAEPASASYALRGVLFFGAVVKMDSVMQHISQTPALREISLDCSQLLALDTSGADALEQIVQALALRGGHLTLRGLGAQPLSLVQRTGLSERARIAA